MSSSVDSVLVGNLWTPRCFEDTTRICLSSQRPSTSKLSTSGAYNLTWIAWSPRLSDKVRCSHVFMTAMNDEAAAEERREEAALGFIEEPSEESGSAVKFVCCSLSFPWSQD